MLYRKILIITCFVANLIMCQTFQYLYEFLYKEDGFNIPILLSLSKKLIKSPPIAELLEEKGKLEKSKI